MNEDILRWSEHEKELNDEYSAIPIAVKSPTFLKVKIINGFDINRKSFLDYIDKPNPQIFVEYPGAVGHKKFETSSKIDTVTPVWNESFRFVLPEKKEDEKHMIKFSLMVEDWYSSSVNIGEAYCDYHDIKPGEKREEIISFGESGKIRVSITKKINESDAVLGHVLKGPSAEKHDCYSSVTIGRSHLRLSFGLCEKELEFRRKRIPKVMRSFQHALKNNETPNNLFETPIMSLVASGGGIRATTAMCGVTEGLDKIGLLDCMTYAFGTSGGSWYLASSFARQAFKGKKRTAYHSWLKKSLKTSCFLELVKYSNMKKCRKVYEAKAKAGQPFTLVDFYGICAANKVLAKKFTSNTLSNLRNYVETADVPYVVLNSSHVDDAEDVRTYRADCNLTAHECEMPQYGVNVDSSRLNSLFFSGVMERKLPEPDLAYLIGTLGSIFGLGFNRIFGLEHYEEQLEKSSTAGASGLSPQSSEDSEDSRLHSFLKWISSFPGFQNRNKFVERTGQVLNISRGFGDMKRRNINPFAPALEEQFDGFEENAETMNLVDGGILCNVAIDAALRPQRRNDILFVADITSYDQDINFETLTSAIRLAKEGGYKFPNVDIEKIKREQTKELYVFEDENDPECPLVFWLLTATKRFKQVSNYTPRDPKVLKELREGERFNDFDVMESDTYDTFNFRYSNLDFDRLRELMIYNIVVNEEIIKSKIRERIERKRKNEG